MMVSFLNALLLWSFCVTQSSDVFQPDPFQAVELGDSTTIECHSKSDVKKAVWYRLTTGKQLQLVVALNSLYNRSVFAAEFGQRYSVKFDSISSHLSISAATWDDVGTYFCGVLSLNHIIFASGTFLMIKGAHMMSDSVVQRPESETVQPGGSVNLSCSVHIGQCAAEQTDVMWLKNSHHSTPQMIYSAGSKNPICQSTKSGQTTCVYSLLLRNLSSDEAGTYYCVATSCGQIQFGNGTGINIHSTASVELSPAIVALTLSNVLLGIVMVILIWMLCKNQGKDSTETTDGSSGDNLTRDDVIYASVCLAPRSFPTRQATVKTP